MSTLQNSVSSAPVATDQIITEFEMTHQERARIGAKFPASFLTELHQRTEKVFTDWCAANSVPAAVKDLAIDMAMLYQTSTAIVYGHPEDANLDNTADLVTDVLARIDQVEAL